MKPNSIAGAQPEAMHSSTAYYNSSSLTPTRARAAEPLATAARAIAFVWSLITWPIDWLRDFFGVEPMGGRAIEGEIVVPCSICSDPSSDYVDGHALGAQCPRLMEAQCAECVDVVTLTRFGLCSNGGALHTLANRRPARTLRVVR